ncbi:enoyl-CoA hydratase/isomerase family protein [Hydrocarboniphaga sp.]|uniref:enoyl-CoA hydratase/isomerase family protein n=1 Tax=Hydrocarboniphaga sp. TaxID=2033016 RepID=UPI003D100574
MSAITLDGYNTLTFELDDAVLTVALNRPEQFNATNAEMEIELCRFFTDVAHDAQVRVVVLTGQGKAFSGGGDFAYIREVMDEPPKFWNAMAYGKRLIFSMLDCPKPIVAKINGHAMGLGATLALFCDVSFAADHVKIADPHVAIGFVAGDGGAVIWPQLIGYNRAKEFLFTGDPLLAPEAERLGLINHAVPAAELDARVKAYADKVSGMPARAVQWTKASINIGLKQLAHSIMDASIAYEALSNTTADHREAMDAIRDKRKPDYNGN